MNGNKFKQKLMAGLALMMVGTAALAQGVTVDPAISSGIADGIALVLLIVALGGAGYIAIASAGTGWTVGAKFIKRLGGKA